MYREAMRRELAVRELRSGQSRVVDPAVPEKTRRFVPPAAVLRRVVDRTRRLPPSLPRDWEPRDEPWWWGWYRRGIELNRARSLAALSPVDRSRSGGS